MYVIIKKERDEIMNKQEIYEFIKNKNIWYEITEHEAVYNMEELSKIKIPYPEYEAKNIFVRDDKKTTYYLITIKDNKRVDLKMFKNKHNTKSLSFAKENELAELMNLIPGAVSPLGLLNDKNLKIKFYLDKDFMKDKKIIGIHPNDNTATIWLRVEDLIDIIEEHGNELYIIDF